MDIYAFLLLYQYIDNLDTLIDIQNIPQLNNASISQQPSVQSCFSRPLQLEIDKHYSLELCFSIEKQPETVWRGGCLA